MSREKFEEIYSYMYLTIDTISGKYQDLFTQTKYEGWLAGRESMRDEAANACEGFKERNASSIAAKCSQEIRKIEP